MASKKRFHKSKNSKNGLYNGNGLNNERRNYSRDPLKQMHDANGPYDVAMHRLGDEFYAGYRGRTVQEHADYTMLNEDRNAIANMPQNVIMKMYPKINYSMQEGLNDDIRGVDYQINQDGKRQKKGEFPEKY